MVIMEPDEFQEIENDCNRIKFIAIGDNVCVIALKELIHSEEYRQVQRRMLDLTQDYVDSLPKPTRSVDHVTMDFLTTAPVLMFESSEQDGRYHRWDGRHRIKGAWKNGITSVPALWFPRETWSKFLIGFRLNKILSVDFGEDEIVDTDVYPYVWERTPFVDVVNKDRHFEQNFTMPSEASKFDIVGTRP